MRAHPPAQGTLWKVPCSRIACGDGCPGLPPGSPHPLTAQGQHRPAPSITLPSEPAPSLPCNLPTCTCTSSQPIHASQGPRHAHTHGSRYARSHTPQRQALFIHYTPPVSLLRHSPSTPRHLGTPCHLALTEIILVTVLTPHHLSGFQLPN